MVIGKTRHIFLSILVGATAAGCSGSGSSGGTWTPSAATTPAVGGDHENSGYDDLAICSKLDFSDLDWPSTVSVGEREPFALALNISGSFEGTDGWANLTNNFDGQGLSMGLLNQCLGQGSLQPLLIQMRDQYVDEMRAQFSTANFNSLLGMLKKWESSIDANQFEDLLLTDYGFSKLDDAKMIESVTGFNPDNEFHAELSTKNQNSVNWAVANLYNKSSFKTDWAKQLTQLSIAAGYRSLQVSAALKLHVSALTLFKAFDLKQLRSYLFMFDIVVQNGGIPSAAMTNIFNEFKAHPQWNEVQKLNAILTERLKYVKKEYVKDVQLRKQSIINGTGTVHGSRRDYAKEYCANLSQLMP